MSYNIVRASARLSNERIHESFDNSRKRKASESIENTTEVDEVCVDVEGSSVGTTIKREVTRLYERYYSLNCEDKFVVAQEDWRSLRSMFQKCFDRGVTLDGKLEKKISKIEEIAKKEIQKGRSLCLKYEAKAKSPMELDIFSIYSQYLELLEFHGYIFDKDFDITENNITVKIWSPILERLFRRTTLRTKWYVIIHLFDTGSTCYNKLFRGESVGNSNEISGSSGFKVALRILKDTLSRRRKEADKANVEIARSNPSLIKIATDRTKLHIESKIVLDKLIKGVSGRTRDISIPGLQITGSKFTLCSLKLGANGLYVGVKEGVAVIPNHTSHIKDFRETIKLLYKFKNATMDVASLSLVNDDDSNNSNGPASWVRGTWIPPNTNKKTKLPNMPDILYFSYLNSST
ncbi:hypothetical protein G6F43_006640 [Rhizopus delemar]|nr:hypothetical protein G6F43_006640 [Rhizopus delemar]